MSHLNRRNFIKAGVAVVASSALAIGGRAVVTDTEDPQLVSVEIPLRRLPAVWDGLTIIQLSDFHYDERISVVPIRTAIEMANGLRPDLIVLTGDFVTVPPLFKHFHTGKRAARVAEPCAVLLSQLRPPLGMFAILGNHDLASDPEFIVERLQAHGIQVLRNRAVPLERQGKRIWVAGLDDVLEGDADLDVALRGLPSGEPVVALVHEPDFCLRVAERGLDLQLSGHSHGGQIVIPGLGPPYLPPLARLYPQGLYRVGPLTLYTNVGLGTIRVPARWNCPPEVTRIRLRSLGRSL